ncbi:MAG TPA: outer membrane beta-barrel protein [Daejeonella sp.]|nr:outer membrane beta-barrel protein [Daejeonella sp.]
MFLILASLTLGKVQAQYNFRRYSVGIGAGVTQPYSDMAFNKRAVGIELSCDFYLTPFLTAGLEGQFGRLTGGDRFNDPHLREFDNRYLALTINGKAAFGELLNYNRRGIQNAFKGLYVGAGAGFIKNKMHFVTRVKGDGSNYTFPGADAGINLQVPFMAGISFNIPDAWDETRYILSVGYQMNVIFGEGMDGFNDPPSKFKNYYHDMYSFSTISLKYCFGRKAPFYRSFRY